MAYKLSNVTTNLNIDSMPICHGSSIDTGARRLRIVPHVGTVSGTGSVIRIVATRRRLTVTGGRTGSRDDALITWTGLVRTVCVIVHGSWSLRCVRTVHLVTWSTCKEYSKESLLFQNNINDFSTR